MTKTPLHLLPADTKWVAITDINMGGFPKRFVLKCGQDYAYTTKQDIFNKYFKLNQIAPKGSDYAKQMIDAFVAKRNKLAEIHGSTKMETPKVEVAPKIKEEKINPEQIVPIASKPEKPLLVEKDKTGEGFEVHTEVKPKKVKVKPKKLKNF